MRFYFAPLEGITNFRYRKTHNKYFKGIDKYFIPFLSPNMKGINKHDIRSIDPKNNDLSVKVVPQIISKSSKDTIFMINELIKLGYDEVNLNFGCPSGTVVRKGKGAGMLKDLNYMDKYLSEVFENTSIPISIKIRLGLENELEFDEILKVLNKYQISELIVHPRTVTDFYSGKLHLSYFNSINAKTNFNIIYNGDIRSLNDIDYIKSNYPFVKGIMIGRGLIKIPDLLDSNYSDIARVKRLQSFYNELKEISIADCGENNSMRYEKEIWAHMIEFFDIDEKCKKKLFKAKSRDEFDNIINSIFAEATIKKQKDGIIY